MKKHLAFLILTSFLLAITFCKHPDKHEEPDPTEDPIYPGYQPFPDGYGYMKDSVQLTNAVKNKDLATIRDHAWKLWAGIMQPAASGIDWPIWFTWPTGSQAFPNDTTYASSKAQHLSLIGLNVSNQPPGALGDDANAGGPIIDKVPAPIYNIPVQVIYEFKDDGVFKFHAGKISGILDGPNFAFNGDIMIATESISNEGYNWIRDNDLNKGSKLTQLKDNYLNKGGPHDLDTPPTQFLTKHMYWPVLDGQYSALPVWNNDFPLSYRGYAGYEAWNTIVAIDPSNSSGPNDSAHVEYLYGVLDSKKKPMHPIKAHAKVYGIDNFYHHKVTEEDWANFDQKEKAIIKASSYWAYNKDFGHGDYLVTIACHVNTKEIPTWALQSVWWSDTPDEGKYSLNRPTTIPGGSWQHYKITTSYGIPTNDPGELSASFNPYIELVTHPVATNCNNCHRRGGWPAASKAKPKLASYQNPDCLDLLSFLHADNDCFSEYLLTDFHWIIPDRADPKK